MPVTIQPASLKYKNGNTFQSADCIKGEPGQPGIDGVSPVVSVKSITGGNEVTITDTSGDHSFDVMDGAKGDPGDPTEIIDDTAGAGYTDKTWSADKIDDELSTLNNQIQQKQDAPASGATAGKVLGLVEDNNELKPSWVSQPTVPVTDVQVNGVSVLSQGVANVPVASENNYGAVKTYENGGTTISSDGKLILYCARPIDIKQGNHNSRPIVPANQKNATFYGLASAAGDSTQSASNNSVGTYTESAKSAISQMLDAPETISGTTPSITAKAGVRYVCGECATLTITAPASGDIEVIFDSGSTPTVLTVTPPTGVTAVRWANGFDPTSLDANTTYDIIITDGKLGMVASWA